MTLEMSPKLPQLAANGDPESIPGAVAEPKMDGHRMLAFVGSDRVGMFARTGVDKSGKLPNVERALLDLPAGTILDGEVVALNRTGGDWAGVQSVLGASERKSDALTFVVFDVLQVRGEDIRLASMATRRLLLERLFEALPENGPVMLIEQVPYTPEFVRELIAGGFEGAIVKDPTAPYASGKRGHGWVKVKATETLDVVVMGATEGKGKYAGQIGALIFGQYDWIDRSIGGTLADMRLVELGQCSGFDDALRAEFSQLWDDERRDPTNSTLTGMVIEIQHMGAMPSGGLRHPQFKRIRTDKLPTECVA